MNNRLIYIYYTSHRSPRLCDSTTVHLRSPLREKETNATQANVVAVHVLCSFLCNIDGHVKVSYSQQQGALLMLITSGPNDYKISEPGPLAFQ